MATAASSQVTAQLGEIQTAYQTGATQAINQFNYHLADLSAQTKAATNTQLEALTAANLQRERASTIRAWAATTLVVALAVLVPFTLIWTMLTAGPTNLLSQVATWLSSYWEPGGPILYLVLILALTALPTVVTVMRAKKQPQIW